MSLLPPKTLHLLYSIKIHRICTYIYIHTSQFDPLFVFFNPRSKCLTFFRSLVDGDLSLFSGRLQWLASRGGLGQPLRAEVGDL